MADEITTVLRVTVENGNYKQTVDYGTTKDDQAAQGGGVPGTVSVGTSEEDMTFGDRSTPGVVVLRNLDTTNFVTYGPKSAGSMVAFGRINAGEVARLRLASAVTWRWQADTATVKVQVDAFEA